MKFVVIAGLGGDGDVSTVWSYAANVATAAYAAEVAMVLEALAE